MNAQQKVDVRRATCVDCGHVIEHWSDRFVVDRWMDSLGVWFARRFDRPIRPARCGVYEHDVGGFTDVCPCTHPIHGS